MIVPVAGLDPSLRNWGVCKGTIDLSNGYFEPLEIFTIHTEDLKGKQVRQNSSDLHTATQLAKPMLELAGWAKAVFVEVPVGSQSARAMASYGVCVGVLGAMRASGCELIEVTPLEVKLNFTGKREATKDQMIQTAVGIYPDLPWPMHRGKVQAKAEHMADAIAAIHAGVHTPVFKQLLRLYEGI